MKIYLVGGAVRDELMGKKVKDRDFVVLGSTEMAFKKKFPKAIKVGTRKYVYIVAGREYTLSRFKDIESDLNSRDLTINAFARDESGRLIAHPHAISDLEQKILRPVRENNFFKDPLRVFRAARFAACFPEFKVHHSLLDLMTRVGDKGLLEKIAAERIGNEILRACGCQMPGRSIEILSRTGTLKPWLKEVSPMLKTPAGPQEFHPGTLLEHTIEVMNKLSGSAVEVWMGLCHDLGKCNTNPEHWPAHHGHDITGENKAFKLGQRLRLPNKIIKAGETAARWHMTAGRYDTLRFGTKVDLIRLLNSAGFVSELFNLVRADKGLDFSRKVQADLKAIIAVHLPEKYRGLGRKSGEILHQLCCQALKGEIK